MKTIKLPIVTLDSRPFDSRVYLDKNTKAVKPLILGKKDCVHFGPDTRVVKLVCSHDIKQEEEGLRESDISKLYKIQYRNNRVIIRYNTCSPRHLMLASADLLLFIEMDERNKFRNKCKELKCEKISESKELYKKYCIENTVEDMVRQYSIGVVDSMNTMMMNTLYPEREAGIEYVLYNNIIENDILDKTIAYMLIKLIRLGKYMRNELWFFNRGKCDDDEYKYNCMMYKIISSYAVEFLNAIPLYQGQQCTALNLYTQYYDDDINVSTKIYGLIDEVNKLYERVFK